MTVTPPAFHAMPFGAQPGAHGTRFRLWAPAARRLDLVLLPAGPEGPERAVPMEPEGDGWFSREEPAAPPGTLYCYRADGGLRVPDPASRHQPRDAHGPSLVTDPADHTWQHPDWTGRPWHEVSLVEVHVGTATPEGTFEGLRRRLPHYRDLGVSAIELMPVADFPGERNWGYDGVQLFAPDSAYGTPAALKRLVDEAHGLGLMVFLDVVYNHFGPDGNYLHVYAPDFFTDRIETPWGAAIDFSRRPVRDFCVHNALFWLAEYRFDGLRLDAVHAIHDDSDPHILTGIATRVDEHFAGSGRHIHLVLENDDNAARFLGTGSGRFRAQWNDDFHHAAHVLATGEATGYYADVADDPLGHLQRCLAEGFAWQGEYSPHRGRARGESTARLSPLAFVNFLQNHDQVGNRAFGERLPALTPPDRLHALETVLLLSPAPPLLFMGEEWFSRRPFQFFCAFHEELADAVREGRRREFASFPEFANPEDRARIPDPNAATTRDASRLDWAERESADHAAWEAEIRRLLARRRRHLVPRLPGTGRPVASRPRDALIAVTWPLGDGTAWTVMLSAATSELEGVTRPAGRLVAASGPGVEAALAEGRYPAWTAAVFLDGAADSESAGDPEEEDTPA